MRQREQLFERRFDQQDASGHCAHDGRGDNDFGLSPIVTGLNGLPAQTVVRTCFGRNQIR
jgi:hypothetical protein